MTDACDDQMPRDRAKVTDLKVIQSQPALAILEQPLDAPSTKRH